MGGYGRGPYPKSTFVWACTTVTFTAVIGTITYLLLITHG